MPAPEPPVTLPPGRIVHVRGHGEMFLRDSGGDGPPVLLLHGWMFAADLNWFPVYATLADAGFRVLAVDHRGHGRGLRTSESFKLADCAADAAALVRHLRCGPVIAVGYSMGGPIAQLMARGHRDEVAALVCCATAMEWQSAWQKVFWRTLGLLRLQMGLFPTAFWKGLVRLARTPKGPESEWVAAELSRGSGRAIAEAGHELAGYDARGWIAELAGLPSAVVLTTKDRSVPPRKQRELAKALGARTFDVRADHMAVATNQVAFRRALMGALRSVAPAARGAVRAA